MASVRGVPLVDVGLQTDEIADEVREGFARVIDRSAFILGEEVAAFEAEFAEFCGVEHCIGVGNGTDALELALRAVGVGTGDDVLLPVNSFVASASAVRRAGATPVLVDVDPHHLLLDVEQAADRCGPRTRAVMPVHLYGQMPPMGAITKLAASAGASVVEDAAQAHGASHHGTRAGAHGAAAATSFYPGKNLGAFGDAGAVLTGSSAVARTVQALRNHGSHTKYEHSETGFNSRLDTLQAVVLSAKLSRLERWNEQRRAAAAIYDALLADVDEVRRPTVAEGNVHVWHLYVVRVAERDDVVRRMSSDGISVGVHYPLPIHMQGAFSDLRHRPGDFPVAETAATEILSLPIYQGITPDQQEQVVGALVRAVRRTGGAG